MNEIMWERRDLKARGKAAFKANYWRCVLVALILTALVGGAGLGSSFSSRQNLEEQQQTVQELEDSLNQLDQSDKVIAARIIVGTLCTVFAVSFVLSILVFNPLQVGCQRFFRKNSQAPADLGELGYGFKGNYGRVVKTMLLTDVFLLLWTLLFIIPGIVKAYSYRMVPYILSDEPELDGRAAIDRSRQMMNGQKWPAFVLDLSFILWDLLAALTLGLVGIFYVMPYQYATSAELYHPLKGTPAGTL